MELADLGSIFVSVTLSMGLNNQCEPQIPHPEEDRHSDRNLG